MNIGFENKRTTVIGLGISNRPLIDFLLSHGATVTARDKRSREALGDYAGELDKKGVKLICGENYIDEIEEDVIFRSPGVKFDKGGIPDAVKRGAVLTSEMELFFDLTPAKLIGITGSDGKTTTTTLISLILKDAGYNVYVGGNIGTPLLSSVEKMNKDDICVLELSSFQLQTMKKSPSVSVVTNIAPNHLDYHTDMQEYIDAKTNIFTNTGNEKLILNYGNDITRSLASKARENAEILYFNSEEENGVYEKNGAIYYNGERVLDIDDILLVGRHNVENYMAAIGAVYPLVKKENIVHIARTFKGVEHRIELVREKDGVKYYNSSIDSSPTRTAAALNSFTQKVIAICGGYDKHIPFEPLAKTLCKHTKSVVLTGATAQKIKDVLDKYDSAEKPEIVMEADFTSAVKKASALASDGDVVILTPACASFDAFPNFEVRGQTFKNIINGL